MEQIKITLSLCSPLVTNGGYLTLDALLAAIIFENTGDLEQAHFKIPLQNQDGLWFASAAIYEQFDVGGQAFVANLRAMHDLRLEHVTKNKHGKTHTSIGLTRRRDFGAVMNSYDTINTHELIWYATGDADKISQLLQGIEFVGKRRASGFGQVSGLEIEAGELNGVTGHFGEPLRPVPLALFKGNNQSLKADAAWRPAYWHPDNHATCFVPELPQ